MALRIGKVPILRQLYFYLLLTVVATTIFSWLNFNSLCIIATLLVVLIDGNPFIKIKQAFLNPYFLAYFCFFLLILISLAWSENTADGWKNVERKATLIAVPFLVLAGPLKGKEDYKKLMTAWCILLFLTTMICLVYAVFRYIDTKDITVFFYHSLVDVISQNAIWYSIFLLLGLLFLLSSPVHTGIIPESKARSVRLFLVFFFIAVIILLSSKLMLVILGIILFGSAVKNFSLKKNRFLLGGICAIFLVLVVALIATDNPIRKRYQEAMMSDLEIVSRPKYAPDIVFNGVSLRLIQWRFAVEILNENEAWVAGVGPGDSQDLLDRKYINTDMYIGERGRDKGFLGYDFHNQFIEQQVQTGIIGLTLLVGIFFLLFRAAKKARRADAWFSIIVLAAVCLTESLLELQHGLFLFSFYPFVLLKYIDREEHTQPAAKIG